MTGLFVSRWSAIFVVSLGVACSGKDGKEGSLVDPSRHVGLEQQVGPGVADAEECVPMMASGATDAEADGKEGLAMSCGVDIDAAAGTVPTIVLDPIASAPAPVGNLSKWEPPAEAAGSSGVKGYIDLSARLPDVGRQSINDCVAWASTYYLRSYLWAWSSGTPASSPERQFSPTYVYNQINGGRDEGSHITNALDLLGGGAPSLRVAPYHTRYTEQPSYDQFLAARDHTVTEYRRVTSRAGIEVALYKGLPSLIHVTTDQEFNSGRHPVYNAAIRKRSRDPLAHGRHAMLVVGLDPTEGACRFKLVNSWGRGWGQHGFTWVDCALFDKIDFDGGENFVQEAFVITGWADPEGRHDLKSLPEMPKIDTTITPRPDETTRRELQSFELKQSTTLVSGSDKEAKWRWILRLRSDDPQLSLRSPALDDEAGCIRYPKRYECVFGEAKRAQDVMVRVTDCTGRCQVASVQTLKVELGDAPVAKELKLSNQALLLKGSKTGRYQNFNWTVFIDASPGELKKIESVTYKLHKTFPQATVKVTESPGGGFPLSAVGWGEFNLEATVHYKDPKTNDVELTHCLQLGFDTKICGEKKGRR